MNRDQKREHPTWPGDYLKLVKKRECEPMARSIFAIEAVALTPSLPKPEDARKIAPLRVGDRKTLGWEGPRSGGLGCAPFRQNTMTSAVLFLKCS